MSSVTLSNLQVEEEPLILGGNPNAIQLSADIIINTNDINEQPFFYEVRNSQNEIIAMQIHPQDHKIKPNTKENFKIGINQPSKNAYFPNGNYILNAWSVSTWTGRRFDWKQPLANLGHTGIKEWNPSSNVASISKKVSRIGTGFQRGQAYQPPAEPTVVSGVKPFEKPERVSVFQPKFITLSQNTQSIINGIESGSITVPAWFMNNIDWVKSGQITETEFVNAYNFLSPKEPEVTIAPLPPITIPSIPEVSAVMELITTNFQVKLNNKIQFSSSLSNADYKRLQDEMSLEPKITLVFLNQTDFNPLSNFSKILRQIQKLLEGQVVETTGPTGEVIITTTGPTGEVTTETTTTTPTGETITETTTVMPTKPGLMGAGVLGVIGILMLGGFIADHVRKRK